MGFGLGVSPEQRTAEAKIDEELHPDRHVPIGDIRVPALVTIIENKRWLQVLAR